MTPEGLDPTPKLDRPVGSLPGVLRVCREAVTPRRARPHPQAGQAGRFSAGRLIKARIKARGRQKTHISPSICPTVFGLIYLIAMH